MSADFQPRCGVKNGTLPRNHLASSATGGASAVSAKTRWFLDFLLVGKSLACYGPERELTLQQTRCRSRSGEGDDASAAGQSFPHGRAEGFFDCPCSGSDSRNTPIPCVGGSQDVSLTYRKGSFETFGFKRLFCPLFQLLGKVGRRRHVPYAKRCC